jgi:arylsulfatase A
MLYQMILFFLGLGMQNNFFIKIIMILYLMILGMPLKAKDLKSPNFIVVLADDLGWSSLSSTMDKKYPNAKSDYHKTPNIDHLVESGMRFSNAYSSSPVCSPSRYSIQFGKSPAKLNITRVLGKNKVDHDQIAIPQILKSINPNYVAAHFGKWHINESPDRYGYDFHDGMTTNKEGGFDQDRRLQWGGYSENDPKRVYSLTSRTINFIKDSISNHKPFYVQLSHYAVHSNIVYSKSTFKNLARFDKGTIHKNHGYAAMISDFDESVGQLLEVYEEMGLADNTYIIFTSDNGGMPVLPMQVNRGKPYSLGLNSPLLRGKWDLMEGGIRVPFSIVGPDIPIDSQSDIPIIGHDLLPTIADLVGSMDNLPEDIDGGSFKNLLFKKNDVVERSFDGLIFHFPHYNRVGMNEPHSAIRYKNYKYIYFPASNRELLFDIEKDIGEKNDLSKLNKKLAKKLRKKLNTYLDNVNAEKANESESWSRIGEDGSVKTRFFERYIN